MMFCLHVAAGCAGEIPAEWSDVTALNHASQKAASNPFTTQAKNHSPLGTFQETFEFLPSFKPFTVDQPE